MKKGIIGNGGFGREVYYSLTEYERENTIFFVDDEYFSNQENTKPLSHLDVNEYEIVVAVGDPVLRSNIVSKLPKNTKYFTHIHESVIILGDDVYIGEGSIICAGSILTTNIQIGSHSHLNLNTTIGHDCTMGNFFTTAPGVSISGNNIIGDRVYFGTRASSKQKLSICSDVRIGLNSGVVKNINESGVYIGTPSVKIK
jgi:sugar O-acyltransferase (sialic acid O-acetyltransferase NeuD family)